MAESWRWLYAREVSWSRSRLTLVLVYFDTQLLSLAIEMLQIMAPGHHYELLCSFDNATTGHVPSTDGGNDR